MGILCLERKEFRNKILNNFEVIEVLNEDKVLNEFLMCIQNAKYNDFFRHLLTLDSEFIQKDDLIKKFRFYLLRQI